MQDTERPAHHASPVDEVLEAVETGPDGLSAAEAERRLQAHGPNSLPEPPRRGALRRFLAQFANVLIYVLIAAAAVTAVLGHWVDTGVILAVVVVNAHRVCQEGAPSRRWTRSAECWRRARPCCATASG